MGERYSKKVFSELAGQFYECTLDRTLWPQALAELRGTLNFHNAALGLQALPSGRMILNITDGMSDPWRDSISRYDRDIIDMWGGLAAVMTFPLDRPAILSEVMSPEELAQNRYIREWREPQGLNDSMVMVVARDATAVGSLAMGRHRDAGPIGPEEVELMSLLIPHIQRAAKIGRLLDDATNRSRDFASVIEQLSMPVLMLGPELAIVHLNRAASAMLDDGTLLRASRNTLVAPNAKVATMLNRALAAASRPDGVIERAETEFYIGSTSDELHAVQMLPLKADSTRPLGKIPAVAALFVSAPYGRLAYNGDMIRGLFGLTATELAVFDEVAAGLGTGDIARRLSVAPSTIRTHLLHIYDKMGVHRRADLARLAYTLAVPVTSAHPGMT